MTNKIPAAGPKISPRLLLTIAGCLILLRLVGIKPLLVVGAIVGLGYLAQKHLPAR